MTSGAGAREVRPLASVHVDLDGARHIFQAHGWPYESREDGLFTSGLRHALELFERERVTATLFVIAEDLMDPHKRTLIEAGVRAGHEIASHSVTHARLTRLDDAARRREIVDSASCLASTLGVSVRGFRAPGFHCDPGVLGLVDEAGYDYDSSLLAGRSGRPAQPHRPLPGRRLVELPVPTASPLALPFHPSYSLVAGDWYFRAALSRHRRTGAPLILLFHLTDFADPLPRAQVSRWQQRLFTLSQVPGAEKRRRCAAMLDFVRRHFAVVSTTRLLAEHDGAAADPAEAVS